MEPDSIVLSDAYRTPITAHKKLTAVLFSVGLAAIWPSAKPSWTALSPSPVTNR